MKTELKYYRKKAGYRTAEQFANHVHIPVSTYRKYETGESTIPFDKLWLFADELYCTMDDIAGRTKRNKA